MPYFAWDDISRLHLIRLMWSTAYELGLRKETGTPLQTLCICHWPSPRGGTLGKYNFIWGLLGGFEWSFYPVGGENEGGLVSAIFASQGNRGLCKRNRSISSCLTSILERPLYRRTWALLLVDVKNGGGRTGGASSSVVCKYISIVLFLIFAAWDITMEDDWLTLDFCFSLCKLIVRQEKI